MPGNFSGKSRNVTRYIYRLQRTDHFGRFRPTKYSCLRHRIAFAPAVKHLHMHPLILVPATPNNSFTPSLFGLKAEGIYQVISVQGVTSMVSLAVQPFRVTCTHRVPTVLGLMQRGLFTGIPAISTLCPPVVSCGKPHITVSGPRSVLRHGQTVYINAGAVITKDMVGGNRKVSFNVGFAAQYQYHRYSFQV